MKQPGAGHGTASQYWSAKLIWAFSIEVELFYIKQIEAPAGR